MSVTAVNMFLRFYPVVAISSVKSARQIKVKKNFLEKWPLWKDSFKFFIVIANLKYHFEIFVSEYC